MVTYEPDVARAELILNHIDHLVILNVDDRETVYLAAIRLMRCTTFTCTVPCSMQHTDSHCLGEPKHNHARGAKVRQRHFPQYPFFRHQLVTRQVDGKE